MVGPVPNQLASPFFGLDLGSKVVTEETVSNLSQPVNRYLRDFGERKVYCPPRKVN